MTVAPSAIAWPQKLAESQAPVMDSAQWNGFVFRDDDIVVATYSKSGTTLTQQICAQLLFDADPALYGAASTFSPWIDFRATPDARAIAERQTHRRILKTHLPLENLVFSPKARYLAVARDPRDVVWSWHNHVSNFTPDFRDTQEHWRKLAPVNIHDLYHAFLDGPGQPIPNLYWRHVQGWWNARCLPNVMMLHYAWMVADLPRAVRNIAAFVNVALDESKMPALVAHCSPEHMRRVAAADPHLNFVFKEGSTTFINKATNGRWREVLCREDIEKAEQVAARELTADCAAWLMSGGRAAA